MPARLIINADDFGLTPGINRAILELHQANVLTSATLMASGPAFDDAVALAQANPTLGVGCHVVLTDGLPVSPPETIPTLLAPGTTHLRPSLIDFLRALVLGRIKEQDIEREAEAQIQKLLTAGIRITHLDTHKHTHLFPQVTRPLLRIAERLHIPAVRNPFERPWSLALNHGPRIRRLQVNLLSRLERSFEHQSQIATRTILTPRGSLGISATGDLTQTSLSEILKALPNTNDIWELVCHPGYSDPDLDRVTTRLRRHREIEREALLTCIPARMALPNPPQLIHFGDLPNLRSE